MIHELNSENFEEFINSDKLSVVELGAEFCGPCRMVKPILKDVSETLEGGIRIGTVDTDNEGELAKSLEIRSIPTTLFYKSGTIIKRRVGMYNKEELNAMIDETKNRKV